MTRASRRQCSPPSPARSRTAAPLQFDKTFGDCTFAIEGEGSRGGTKIKLSGHGFFKDFTIKDGNIIENHGGHGEMSSEVTVHQVVWMAESGKTLPREYSFKIKTGDHEQTGRTVESWPRSTACGCRRGTG